MWLTRLKKAEFHNNKKEMTLKITNNEWLTTSLSHLLAIAFIHFFHGLDDLQAKTPKNFQRANLVDFRDINNNLLHACLGRDFDGRSK